MRGRRGDEEGGGESRQHVVAPGGRLVKRPSLLSVLGGRQWSDELDKISKCLVKRCLDFISFFFMQLLLVLHSKILLDAVSA